MVLESGFGKKDEIYNRHLREINNVKFTSREVDVIACILYNRGDSKIARLLSISYRTVGTHIRNILSKLGYGSREYIRDAVENSGKLQYIRQYYFHLITQSAFEKKLQKIGALTNRGGKICVADYSKVSEEEDKLLKQIEQSLKPVNITLINRLKTGQNPKDICGLYIISEKHEARKETNLFSEEFQNNIGLLLDKNIEPAATLETDITCIDFRDDTGYYFAVLKLLKEIINKPELTEITREFEKEYTSFQSSWEGEVKESESEVLNIAAVPDKRRLIIFICSIVITLFLSLAAYIYNKPAFKIPSVLASKDENNTDASYLTSKIKELILLSKNGEFSSDNVKKESMSINYSLVKRIEEILNGLNKEEREAYFKDNEPILEDLAHYIHALLALSTYYTHNEHDGEKAREILIHAKSLMEDYVNKRSNVKINFDRLSFAELHSELAIIKDLPEMYTRITYLLARTFIYQGDRNDAIKYFEISKYLGNKLGLFEGYLSEANGLEVIRKDKIDGLIKNGAYEQAKQHIHESIKLYKQLRDSDFRYKINYKPGETNPKLTTLKENVYAAVECSERIAGHYAKLIGITNDSDSIKKGKYLTEIGIQFFGDRSTIGMLSQLDGLPSRKIASIYNTLGNILLLLADDKTLNFSGFKKNIIQHLKLTNSDLPEIIKQIFELAGSQSRNTDYTKADSYDGLIKVYRKQIELGNLTEEQKNKFSGLIRELENKRNDLNRILKRKQR
jgi:DNA-binding CsgD family transcriptional regulator